MTAPLCLNCKWFEPYASPDQDTRLILSKCGRTEPTINPVNGDSRKSFCANERESMWALRCGPTGRFYEPSTDDIIP